MGKKWGQDKEFKLAVNRDQIHLKLLLFFFYKVQQPLE